MTLSYLKSNLILGVEIELVLGVFMLMCCGSEYPRGSQASLWRFHIKSYRDQEDSVLDNSSKFPNHQITLNLELCNSSYDQNNMTVKTDL